MEREAGQQGGSGKTTSDQKNASEPGVNSDPENFSVDWGHLSYRRADGRMFYRRTNRGTRGTSGESGAGSPIKYRNSIGKEGGLRPLYWALRHGAETRRYQISLREGNQL